MVISLLRCVWCHVLGSLVLAYLYIELYKASAIKTSQLCGPHTFAGKVTSIVYAYIILIMYMKLI